MRILADTWSQWKTKKELNYSLLCDPESKLIKRYVSLLPLSALFLFHSCPRSRERFIPQASLSLLYPALRTIY